MRVLILDNFDSFVYNLSDYVGKLCHETFVLRSNKASIEDVLRVDPDRIIISPGPGHPSERRFVGVSRDVLENFSESIPILGVCLGMQLIAHVFGAKVLRAKRIVHGKTSLVEHDGRGIFDGLRNPLEVGRYHSLVVDEATLPNELEVVARSLDDGEVMAIRHVKRPLVGLQFHPESVLTVDGLRVLSNFLRGCV